MICNFFEEVDYLKTFYNTNAYVIDHVNAMLKILWLNQMRVKYN